MSDREIAAKMSAMEIDIAIDLAGYTTGARTNLFALRAAPVQINYLGFPGSMGVEFIDYIIADDIVLPASHEEFYSERVLRMPNSYLPFDNGRVIPDAGPTRAAAGLPDGALVFCAFNNGYKITRSVFDAWMGLLREVPDSVLWLRSASDELAAALRMNARRRGIADSRLLFAGYERDMDAHLARLRLADIFLDTQPYNAHTTAVEALWAGVPVISIRGSSFAGRVGASVLAASQMPDLVNNTIEEYQAMAAKFAHSDSLRLATRARLRQVRDSAPLFDTASYTRDLENLLLSVCKRS
jgi:predicted O-linked N-acetylglucosamine transferase (SPINDLY family)